ncbi:hypothetical protein [Steroidobacter gossypii]|nr:hypothetical protein [Steroidobacter gossypii]
MQTLSIVDHACSRPARSTATRRVNQTLQELMGQFAFSRLELGKARVGRVTHRLFWHHGRACRFIIDFDASAVTMPALVPATPQLLRELQATARSTGMSAPALDPSKGELRVFTCRGSLTLSVTVLNNAFDHCTEYLINLADFALRWNDATRLENCS